MIDDQKANDAKPEALPHEEESLVRRFLLGETDEAEQQQVEKRLLREDAYVNGLLTIEEELIDDYARGSLDAHDSELFERNFLTTPKRQQKLSVAQSLVEFAESQPEVAVVTATPVRAEAPSAWRSWFFPTWKLVAYAFVLIAAGWFGWRTLRPNAELDRGLIALNQAFRQQRPLEARIAGFDYAPFVITRGPTSVNTEDDATKGDYATLDEAEVLLRKAARERGDTASLKALGRLYLAKKEFAKAVEQFELALKALPANAPPAPAIKDAQLLNDLGSALFEKSRISQRLGDQQQGALELGRSLDELNQAVEADPNLLEAVFNRALCRQTMGLQNQAIAGWNEYLQKDATSRWADEARQHLQDIEAQRKKVAGMKERAYHDFVAAYDTRDETQAWEAFKIARNRNGNSITDRLIDDWLALAQSGNQAEAETKLRLLEFGGDLARTRTGDRFAADQAAYYRQRAARHLTALTQARQKYKEAEKTYNEAKLQTAHDLYAQAAKLFRVVGNEPERLFAESWMGYCQTRLSRTTEAVSTFNGLIESYKSKNYKSLQAYGLQAIADAYTIENEWSLAIENTRQSITVLGDAEDWLCYFRGQATLASIKRILGMYEDALTANWLGINTSGQYPVEPRQVWNLYSSLSLSLLNLGYGQSAMDVQQEAHFIAKKAEWPLYQSLSHARQGIIQVGLGKGELAIEIVDQALNEAAQIVDESARADISADVLFLKAQLLRRISRHLEAIQFYEMAVKLYEKTPYHLFSYRAYQGSFLSRIAIKDEIGSDKDLGKAVTLLDSFRGKILEENFRDSFFDDSQEFNDAAIDYAYSGKNDAERAFQFAENCRARSFLDSKLSAPQVLKTKEGVDLRIQVLANPLSLQEIQKRMPEQVQLIQYSVLQDKVIIWVVSQGEIYSNFAPIAKIDLAEKIARLVFLITSKEGASSGERVALSKELYSVLLDPIESHLKPQKVLCIVPDKELNYLPFSALVSSSSGNYLIENHTLTLSFSATTFILCSEESKERHVASEDQILSIGNPKLPDSKYVSLLNLFNAENEARRIAAMYRRSFLLIGDDAKESLFVELASKVNVLHFAGHAIVDEFRPLSSRLLLAKDKNAHTNDENSDGALHVYELLKLRLLKLNLVVLSSCKSGSGRVYQSEGMVTLARSFLIAGVPAVVASLWDIDSEKTEELMVQFHALRKRYRLPASEALRQAQLEMISAERTISQPSLAWAGFNVIGGDYTSNLTHKGNI